jgi:GcrA cell cycle regulator
MLREVYDEAAFTETLVESARRCSLFELSKEHCRWPVNAEAEEFSFCGNTPLTGLPYCQGHTRLAYRSLARRAS